MATNPFLPTIHERFHYWFSGPLWDEVTAKHTYQDKNESFNELSDTPAAEWLLVYQFVKQIPGHWEALAIFDAHYNDRRTSRTFTFTTKEGVQIPNCRYKEYTPSHDGHKSWFQTRTIRIRCSQYVVGAAPPTEPNFVTFNGEQVTFNGEPVTFS